MRLEDIQKIADTYGYNSQSRMLIEEMAELTKALCKAWRIKRSVDTDEQIKELVEEMQKARANVIEEIADVEIMIAQIKYLMQCNHEVIQVREQKIARQLERIKQGGNNGK